MTGKESAHRQHSVVTKAYFANSVVSLNRSSFWTGSGGLTRLGRRISRFVRERTLRLDPMSPFPISVWFLRQGHAFVSCRWYALGNIARRPVDVARTGTLSLTIYKWIAE